MQNMRGLFLGIGGTGDEILSHLKDKVYATNGCIPEKVQFRLFDTEADDYRKNNSVRLGDSESGAFIADNEYVQLKDEPAGSFRQMLMDVAQEPGSVPEVAKWCKAELFLENLSDADYNLVRGAGQHRQFARLGVFLNKQRIINTIRHALQKCRVTDGETPIWIIGSIAGGTGAGLLCDLALLTKWVAKDMDMHTNIMGAAVLPDVYTDVSIDAARANSVLRELERFQGPVQLHDTGRIKVDGENVNSRYAVEYDATTKIALQTKLFDNLVFYNRKCIDHNDRSSYFSEIADGLNLILDNSAGNQLFREAINGEEGYAASFNTYRVFIPASLYARQFVLKGALEIASEGILPRDPDTKFLKFGHEDDRIDEANAIFEDELYRLLSNLKRLKTNEEFAAFKEKMQPGNIVNSLLGFVNPTTELGIDIGTNNANKAKQLYADIYKEIPTCKNVKEDFEEAKDRIQAEVKDAYQRYWGDGETSFKRSLECVEGFVKDRIKASINTAAKSYLSRYSVREQSFGRLIKILHELSGLVKVASENLARLTEDWSAEAETKNGAETDALSQIAESKKSFLGWRNKMAELQQEYLDCATASEEVRQKMRLKVFIESLLALAEEHIAEWLDGMREWQVAINSVVDAATSENIEIEQRLERQTKIRSASMGLNNTPDMNGYRDFLQDSCLTNPDTGKSYISELLAGIKWQAAENPKDIQLSGWPDAGNLNPGNFAEQLNSFLQTIVGERMSQVDGMARYLKWLRDEKSDTPSKLADGMRQVTSDFIVAQSQDEGNRKFLMLYGDNWHPDHGQNEFTNIYNKLTGDGTINNLRENITTSDGVNLFQDRNTLAIMMSDDKVRFGNIPAVKNLRNKYFDVRQDENAPWRSQCYHLFRAEQEAWQIEHDNSLRTDLKAFPMIPGEYSRLLDDPDRIRLFGKALISGIVRQHDLPLEGRIWVAAAPEADESDYIYLNDPSNPKEKMDLFRAFVTFVEDRKDRRQGKRGNLTQKEVEGWIKAHLIASEQTLAQCAVSFESDNKEFFDVSEIDSSTAIKREHFLALTLNYYLKNLLN